MNSGDYESNILPLPEITGSILGVGIDLVENARVERMLDKFGERLLTRCFTPAEGKLCREAPDFIEAIAVRWAAKEACFKGINGRRGMNLGWREFEILLDNELVPYVKLGPFASGHAKKQGIDKVFISLTHERKWSAAIAISTSVPVAGK
ncbi:MAG: holo-ACP synthase [bacterium]